MGNRRRAYKPNSRTRQKRAAAQREWELEHPEDAADPDGAATEAPVPASRQPSGRSVLSRLLLVDRSSAGPAPADETRWSRRGLATMCLISAVLCIPLGTVSFFSQGRAHPFAAYIVGVLNPLVVIPIPLTLTLLLAMPLARALAHEGRSLRVLETLGFAAVVQILLIFFWSPVLNDNSWSDHADATVGAAVADLAAFAGGVLAYPAVSSWLQRRRARR